MANERIQVELTLEDGQYRVSMKGAGALSRKFQKDIDRLNTSLKNTERSMERTERRVRGFTSTLRDWSIIIGQARNVIRQLSFVTYDWMRSIILANAEVERMTYLMKGLSDAGNDVARLRDANDTVRELFTLAKQAPFSINALSDTFVKFRSVGLDPMNGSMQSLIDAVAAFGGTDQVLHRASIAIQQMAGKGVISMEELRQQLGEAVPQSITLMARSIGTTYGELVDAISKGQVEAKGALEAMFLEFERTFGGRAQQLMESFNGQMARMRTSIMELVTQTPGMKAFFEAVKDAAKGLNIWLQQSEAKRFANELGYALKDLVMWLKEAGIWIYENRDALLAMAKGFGVLIGAQAAVGVLRSFYGLLLIVPAAAQAASLAISGVGSAMGIVAGAGGAAVALSRFAGAAARASVPLAVFGGYIKSVEDRMSEFDNEQAQHLIDFLETGRITSKEQYEAVEKALDRESELMVELQARIKELRDGKEDISDFSSLKDKGFGEAIIAQLQRIYKDFDNEVIADKLEAMLKEREEALFNAGNMIVQATDDFMRDQSLQVSSDIETRWREILDGVRNEYIEQMRALEDDEDISAENRVARLEEIYSQYYENQITTYEAMLEDTEMKLAQFGQAGNELAAKRAEELLAIIANLRTQMQTQLSILGAGLGGLKPGGKPGGTSGAASAMERLKRLIDETNRKSDDLERRLVDPFAYELPRAIESARSRIDRLADKISGGEWTQQMKNLFNQIAGNELTEEMLDLAEATREMKRELMGAGDARRDEYEAEKSRIRSMKEQLVKFGAWRVEHEKIIQEYLKTLKEEYFAQDPLGAYFNEWKNLFDDMKEWGADTFDSIGQSLADMVTEGKANWADLARSALNSFLKIQFNAAISGLGSLFKTGIDTAFPSLATIKHSGGVMGEGGGRSRAFDMASMSHIPRFHTGGVIGQEMPAILQKGEGVFTPAQMKAIGAGMSGPSNIKVNIVNNTGTQVESETTNTRMDPSGLVLDVVLKEVQRPGPFRDSMKRALK